MTHPWRTLRSLIPNTISVYLTQQEYEGTGGVGTGAPVDNKLPFKPWRDDAAHYPGSSWFGMSVPVNYTTFKTTSSGQLQLSSVDSYDVLNTYSGAVVSVYKEYRHLFPNGVPTLIPLSLKREIAGAFNYGSNGDFTPPPAIINSNIMLAMSPDGEWAAIDYQDFVRIQREANKISDEQRVKKAITYGLNETMSYKDRASAMRAALLESPNYGTVI